MSVETFLSFEDLRSRCRIETLNSNLETSLRSWEGTKYRDGLCKKGIGVDCVRFVDAVLQEIHGISLPPLPVFPRQASLHSHTAVTRIGLLMQQRFNTRKVRYPSSLDQVSPGTILAAKPRRTARRWAGHVLIVGPYKKSIWHCVEGIGVRSIGGFAHRWEIVRAWIPEMMYDLV